MKKKILRIGLSVLATLLILFTILQIVLLCQIYVSDASKASYLYNKDYFWLKGLCQREDIVKKGDLLMLGRYPTAENGDTRPIAWKIGRMWSCWRSIFSTSCPNTRSDVFRIRT